MTLGKRIYCNTTGKEKKNIRMGVSPGDREKGGE
jgi:hypothetical protein